MQPAPLAVVFNPTKLSDPDDLRARVAALCAEAGWPEPRWYATTADDPGTGMARRAVREGARIVCSLGGDGTVRAVAEGILAAAADNAPADAGGQTDVDEVALGLLPAGTGNLLARNLGLPLDDVEEGVRIVLEGVPRRIDVGRVRFDDGEPAVFLVAAGVGLDAETMAGVDEGVKKRLGWPAYVLAGARALTNPGFRVRLTADDEPLRSRHARSVMVGNCGELTAGAVLMADAEVDDGVLDVMVASPRGIVGWAAVVVDLVTRHRRGHRAVWRRQASGVTADLGHPVEGEIDGDAVGRVRALRCTVEAGVLPVRVRAEAG